MLKLANTDYLALEVVLDAQEQLCVLHERSAERLSDSRACRSLLRRIAAAAGGAAAAAAAATAMRRGFHDALQADGGPVAHGLRPVQQPAHLSQGSLKPHGPGTL